MQKQLSLFQIKQFEEAEKEKLTQLDSMRGMGATSGMTTRSVTAAANMQCNYNMANQLSNTAIGPIQRGSIVGTGVPVMRAGAGFINPNYSGGIDGLNNIPMQNLSASRSSSSLSNMAASDRITSFSLSSAASRRSTQSLGGVPANSSSIIRMRTPQSIENLFEESGSTRRAAGTPARLN